MKMDEETVLCAKCDTICERWVEFFRALNGSNIKISKLNVEDFTDQTAEHFAVGLAESQSVQVLKSNISSTGAVSIFTSLEELDLSSNL